MWFQDLFNYDFRRTEMCIIPYGTQEGEISFCAYNTGIGWRNIIENMHQNATVAKLAVGRLSSQSATSGSNSTNPQAIALMLYQMRVRGERHSGCPSAYSHP